MEDAQLRHKLNDHEKRIKDLEQQNRKLKRAIEDLEKKVRDLD